MLFIEYDRFSGGLEISVVWQVERPVGNLMEGKWQHASCETDWNLKVYLKRLCLWLMDVWPNRVEGGEGYGTRNAWGDGITISIKAVARCHVEMSLPCSAWQANYTPNFLPFLSTKKDQHHLCHNQWKHPLSLPLCLAFPFCATFIQSHFLMLAKREDLTKPELDNDFRSHKVVYIGPAFLPWQLLYSW